MKEKILVSACLVGVNCKYNGGNNDNERVFEYLKDKEIYLVCPEVWGGLTTPRNPSEILNGRVFSSDGVEVTDNYARGAEETLRLAQKFGVNKALLKAKSPSCGSGKVYDGTFTGTLVDGYGITAKLLIDNGIEVISELDILIK